MLNQCIGWWVLWFVCGMDVFEFLAPSSGAVWEACGALLEAVGHWGHTLTFC